MRPVRVLCIVLRLLLLLSALLASYLIFYHDMFISPNLQLVTLTTTTAVTVASPPLAPGREPHIDPASLLQSTAGVHIDESLRMMAYKRLSHKLAGYATASDGSSSPVSRLRRPTQAVSRSEAASDHNSSAIPAMHDVDFTSRDVLSSDSLHNQSNVGSSLTGKAAMHDGNVRGKAFTSREVLSAFNLHNKSKGTDMGNSVTGKPSVPAELHASNHMGHTPLSTSVTSLHISPDFHWPQPHAVRTTRELMTEQWMTDLQNSLAVMTSHKVTLLTSNQQYTEVLLNWLIAGVARASVDLSQVLVIAMDRRLHSLLQEKEVVSVLVRPASLLSATCLRQGVFPTVMMTRLSIIRLLNHWGYDVFNYDTDAVLLRDPSQLLHSGDDIIGTFGRFPTDLTKKWGITLCTAILAVRSSKTTEEFWEVLSRASPNSYSDQGKINYGLQAMNVQWNLPSKNLASLSQTVQGVCGNRLRVSLLPYNIACRAGSCTRKALSAGLYLWHKGGARVGERKREGAMEGGVWFLRSDWTVGCDKTTHREWLKCISASHVFTSYN